MTFLPKTRLILVAALAVMAAPAAQAFTFENPGAPAGNPSALRFGTGDLRFSTNSSTGTNGAPGSSSLRSGNSTLQFGGQSSFNQRYNADRMFDSNNILGKDR